MPDPGREKYIPGRVLMTSLIFLAPIALISSAVTTVTIAGDSEILSFVLVAILDSKSKDIISSSVSCSSADCAAKTKELRQIHIESIANNFAGMRFITVLPLFTDIIILLLFQFAVPVNRVHESLPRGFHFYGRAEGKAQDSAPFGFIRRDKHFHAGFVGHFVAFSEVAGYAGGYNI